MRSGRTLIYDDLQPVGQKLTDSGKPVAIDSVSPLDLVLTHFCGQVETWRRRELPTEAALEWLERAAEAGDAESMYTLGELLANIDPELSLAWMVRAAEAGHPRVRDLRPVPRDSDADGS